VPEVFIAVALLICFIKRFKMKYPESYISQPDPWVLRLP
jgi:hypothetical protein